MQRQRTHQPKDLAKGSVCLALQAFTCTTDPYQALQRAYKDICRVALTAAICADGWVLPAFPSHTERLLGRIKAVALWNLTSWFGCMWTSFQPWISIPLQQLLRIIKVQETRQNRADLLCCLLKNFIPHSQKDKGQVLWFWVCRTFPSIAYNVLWCTHVVNPKAE